MKGSGGEVAGNPGEALLNVALDTRDKVRGKL